MTAVLPGPVVGDDWLRDHRLDVVVADVRWYMDGRSGRAAHEAGHIPGAVFVDLDRDLSAPPSVALGRHPLPSAASFAEALGRLGIGDGDAVVAYDDAGGSIAARLWWMLTSIGQPAAVFDGGITGWTGPLESGPLESGPLESGPVERSAVVREVRPWPADRFVGLDHVDRIRHDPSVALLDARSAARYSNGDPAIDGAPGHVPGARSAPWADNIDPASGGFRSQAELRARFERLEVDRADTVVAYCGSGVTACHDLLALHLAGFTNTALFTGSWSAWSADPGRPATTGSAP
ncbi:MAG: sseA [Acidimicrobiia bacterium]|nr:sseA [Acidimicrobiia bacterium]